LSTRLADPCTIVILGGAGDLARRKLVPALYQLCRGGQLPLATAIVGFARSGGTDETWRADMEAAVREFAADGTFDDAAWGAFARRLFYYHGDILAPEAFAGLKARLDALEAERGLPGSRLFYLAIPPSGIAGAVRNLGGGGFSARSDEPPWSRLVVEKPFGRDLASARALNDEIAATFRERQTFRIDHYLGKETTQNLLVFRLGNGLFEPLWNRRYVDHVQITVAESIGVEGRGRFFEEAGILRDIIQNHALQLLCLVAMEPPVAFEPNAVRDEKVKVLRSIRPQSPEEILRDTVRGQYGPGALDGQAVTGYRQEPNVAGSSVRETYAAWKLQLENWRWAGVPFYLRAAKRMPKRVTEIAIAFRTPPIALFRRMGVVQQEPNVLIVRIQPDEGIALRFGAKRPGAEMKIEPVKMDFHYSEFFGSKSADAYERLLMDAIHGDSTLFARRDEVEAAWEPVSAILETWEGAPPSDMPNYPAGTWGPEAAVALMARDGRAWRRP
jgi:glucose-6-phosphate 1-dehydrogenase